MPLAAVGIICLGLVPTLGGPDRPLHWAMSAGMVGFGVLLRVRHRLERREGPLREVPASVARRAGRSMLATVGVIATLVGGVLLARWTPHSPAAPLSLAMPLVTLAWLAAIGWRVVRHGAISTTEAAALTDRPSRRPPNWDALSAGSHPRKATSSHASL